jgi:antirestriction protein ArdC
MNIPKMDKKQLKQFLLKSKKELADSLILSAEELENFTKMWNPGFHNYSLNNLLLIKAQRPEASLIASYDKWQKLGRQVQKGEKGLKIIFPGTFNKKTKNKSGEEENKVIKFFGIGNVFDISQTEGEEIETGCPGLIEGASSVTLEKLIKVFNIKTDIKELGLSNGQTNGKDITLTPKKQNESMIATYFHELGHIRREHIKEGTSRKIAELEAEAISFLCCKFIGLNNKKAKYYIQNWKGTPKDIEGRGTAILSTAEGIIRELQASL